MAPVRTHRRRVGAQVEIAPQAVSRYPLDVDRINLYSGRFAEQFHGKNQSSDILVTNQDAFHPSNGAILDSDPVTRFQKGMGFNAQGTRHNPLYPFDF